jgi:hypothetical protein
MPPDTIDLLQIKIENAKKQLSDDTLNAIAAVAWQAEIIKMRETRGYTFEQLGALEIETELLLCGLVSPKDYTGELEKRMGISKASANELVEEMNKLVFLKIKEELVKSTERKKVFEKEKMPEEIHDTEAEKKINTQILSDAGIEILNENGNEKKETLPIPEKLELNGNIVHPMLSQKMSGSFQVPIVKTEHTLENITKTNVPVPVDLKPKIPKVDPYREIPE